MTGNSFDLSIGSAGPGELAEFQLSEAMQSEGARVLAVNFPRGANCFSTVSHPRDVKVCLEDVLSSARQALDEGAK